MSNLTELTRIRSDPLEKQLWVKRAHGREMTLSEHLRDLANRDAEGTEPPKRPGPKPKKLGGGEDTVSGRQPAGEDSSPPSSKNLGTSPPARVPNTPAPETETPGEAAVSDSDVPAAPRPSEAGAGGVEGSPGTNPPDVAGGASTGQEVGLTAPASVVVDTSDFVAAKSCDHEPYKTQGNAWCYRCNTRI